MTQRELLSKKIEYEKSRIKNLQYNLDFIYNESRQIKGLSKTIAILKKAIKDREKTIKVYERELKKYD